jgi:hypothetical protein
MKMGVFKFCYSLVLLLLLSVFASAQHSFGRLTEIQDTFRVGVQSGGSVQFKINSLYYYTNGITYTGWTTLKIYCDTLSIGYDNIWKLEVKAMETEDSLQSNYPNRSLGLNNLTLDIVNLVEIDGGSATLISGDITLSNSYQTLIKDGDAGTYEVDISYTLGPTLGKPPAYYVTNLDFYMSTQ